MKIIGKIRNGSLLRRVQLVYGEKKQFAQPIPLFLDLIPELSHLMVIIQA
jgi:hypothetical protein